MRHLWPLVMILAACDGGSNDTGSIDDTADSGETTGDDSGADTDDTSTDTDDTDTNEDTDTDTGGNSGLSYSYGFDTPSTSSTTPGWDGWTSTSSTGGAFGVGTAAALGVNGGFAGQVGYITLSPSGGSAASLAVQANTTWTAPGPGYTVTAFVIVGTSLTKASSNLSMTLKSGTDTRATGSISSGSWTLAGQINKPMELSYTTTADDTNKTFTLEIGAAANCCVQAENMFESLSWTATAP